MVGYAAQNLRNGQFDSGMAAVGTANASPIDKPILGGNTALDLAISKKNIKLMQMLLEAGADVNRKNISPQTPLMRAIHAGSLETLGNGLF